VFIFDILGFYVLPWDLFFNDLSALYFFEELLSEYIVTIQLNLLCSRL